MILKMSTFKLGIFSQCILCLAKVCNRQTKLKKTFKFISMMFYFWLFEWKRLQKHLPSVIILKKSHKWQTSQADPGNDGVENFQISMSQLPSPLKFVVKLQSITYHQLAFSPKLSATFNKLVNLIIHDSVIMYHFKFSLWALKTFNQCPHSL